MACQTRFEKMSPFLSSQVEKEKEQLRIMMAKRFRPDSSEMAAELRTLADALDENLEFQRLMSGRPRTEDVEDQILPRLADLRSRSEKANGLHDDPPRLPTPSQQRSASRDTLRRTERSTNLCGMHNGQSDPRAYGRSAAERLPLGRHYSENDVPKEIVRPSSTHPARSMTPQPARPKTIQSIRSMTPQPVPTSNHVHHGSNSRNHSQPAYARASAHTAIVARGGQDRRRSRPPPPQRLYEVPDPPQTYGLSLPPDLESNPYYRPQVACPSERVPRRECFPRIAEEKRGRKMEASLWASHHETIYQNDSNILEREYDPERDDDAESVGSLDHFQPTAPPRMIKAQNRVTWNGSFGR
ncbi:8fa4600b-7a44-454c-8fe5-822e73e185d6 [Sclerotinia trifoliorum]|uniref:8fa4600b-7a44-454c-8fe5-822e73e185d6 n=1 Tax=Sclerotinia trifoliorum TaxID=28548 RepID=A0A8H2ZPT4_9HELO|nr:8fa4600b-7a44-454c-8fe5-822e73e185d6 [Sclerotinia trifoliorum]